MGRPKGSKNKPKMNANISPAERTQQIDIELTALAEQEETLNAEILDLTSQLSASKAQLRAVKRNAKKLMTEKDVIAQAAENEKRETLAKEIVNKYLSEGKTIDELKDALNL